MGDGHDFSRFCGVVQRLQAAGRCLGRCEALAGTLGMVRSLEWLCVAGGNGIRIMRRGDGLACGELRRLQCRKITKKLGGCLLINASALKTKTAVLR
ncbi:hypothetical protein D1605_002910 [Xylella fastidiosa subsp. fastidiosa]|jgi:hypothetical protein|uniref:Uncharacterized protein n=1 Tax=Xylella fastidiosa (strain M23) TaxID=405441 RepID=B2I929_XYLF2|nr:hypothetical protein [Xylella fastidiosa]ACB92004.1 hypothetical protein XfasM23_0560 [Xylella fastidiosa M23]EGO81210.1 hypothetical protein XFEB_01898 [Xylella fastidiosa EB92.1]KGM20730.1 hypothetical protein JT24_02995 [Xylella fastidiosa]MBE0261525.1 hypothetical protein [Xylella fastidiosa subsp. fastidiosa]MBE0264182.1 hypothetical protein [Xylella fastidiosa subsp. fastidiosa]